MVNVADSTDVDMRFGSLECFFCHNIMFKVVAKKMSRWWELNSRPHPYQGCALPLSYTGSVGAENEVRTRDPQLGRLMLYQLSYFRFFLRKNRVSGLHLGKENSFSFLSVCTGTPQNPFAGPSKFVGGGGLEPPNPEGADLQSAAIATMRTSHWLFQYFKPLSSR